MSQDEQDSMGVKEHRRQGPHDRKNQRRPFVRATDLNDVALYWMPVSDYPMRARERLWLLAFILRLKERLTSNKQLRLETFLQFKELYPTLLDRFLSRSQEYQPMTGLLLHPGAKPPNAPTLEDIEAAVKKGGRVDVNQWMADYCYWFVAKQDEQQREDFLGFGAMMFLFLKPDPKTQPPDLKIPRIMRTHPALEGVDTEAKMAVAFSLQDKFLKNSKEVFGGPMREDPAYPGIPFILPLLNGEDFFRANSEQRAKWFEVVDVYCVESKPTKGVLLAAKDPTFDDMLVELIKDLRDEGLGYQP